ncbi:unnamed protein product [Rhizopus stolonifer]
MSNQEPQQNINTLTHPSVYRDTVNCQANNSSTVDANTQTQTKSEQDNDNWDLYPQLIRKVENEGSENQVKHLHELEK